MKQWKISNYLQVIKGKKKVIIFHSLFGNSFVASKNITLIINFFRKPRTLADLFTKFEIEKNTINELIKNSFIVKNGFDERLILKQSFNQRLSSISNGGLIEHLRFFSKFCNLKCDYCSVNHLVFKDQTENLNGKRNFSWEIAKIATKKFLDLTSYHKKKLVTIRFFGGEPLMDWNIYKKVIEYADNRKTSKIKYYLNTNATLINDEMAKFLKKYGVTVIASIDGPQKSHDAFRKHLNKQGSFLETINGIKILKKYNVNVVLNVTLHQKNIKKLKWVIDFAEDIGVAKIGIEDMCFISNSDYCVNKKDEANAIIKAWQYGQKKGVKVIGSWAGFRKNNYFSFKQPLYCPGNGGEICVNTNGTIYPCYGIQIPIGNIYDLNKIFQNNLYKAMAQRVAGNIKECSGCPLEGPCSGGCVGDILNKTNSLTKVYKEKCNFQKKITFHILKKYFALN